MDKILIVGLATSGHYLPDTSDLSLVIESLTVDSQIAGTSGASKKMPSEVIP